MESSFKKLSRSMLILAVALIASCAGSNDPRSASGAAAGAGAGGTWASSEPLVIGAIPDQEPQQLQRLYTKVADYLEDALDVPVQYLPVTDYAAAVSLFRIGDLDLVWYGGLTGVQARLQVDGARAIVQRDIDAEFHSVFIAHQSTGLEPIEDTSELRNIAGRRFTFGSESSTSGRLMPQFYLSEAGLDLDSFAGDVGFSGDHDKTLQLVESGSYEVGALNEQVWDARIEEGTVDREAVFELFRTPAYFDYHWVAHPHLETRYGVGFTDAVIEAFTSLDPSIPEQEEILELFGAELFIETSNANYSQIEQVARSAGLVE